MTTPRVPYTSGPTVPPRYDEVAAPWPVTVHTCSRLGRRANPPRSWLADLLRPGRRR